MKSFDSRVYSINDFLEWDRNGQLLLNPRFQRRSVWNDNARSYLMDTIIRGKPIPKFFIRQSINPQTRASVREVVDGQQRLRTILLYLNDGFAISKRHHDLYGGKYFSQLDQVDAEVQTNLLNYELAVDLLVNLPDEEVLDIFSRLNSYAVVLNEQERLNANHFSPFKSVADRIAHRYNQFWLQNRILTEQNIMRMQDSGLVADLIIATLEGIRSKKQIKSFYDQYERSFNFDTPVIEERFASTLTSILRIFPESLRDTEFRRIHIFYSLFTAVYHLHFGLKGFTLPQQVIDEKSIARMRAALEGIATVFAVEDPRMLDNEEAQFLEDSRRATTDAAVRIRRTAFLVQRMLSQ